MNLSALETERLLLKKFTPEDFIYIFENYPEQEIKILLGHKTDAEFQKEKSRYLKGYTTYNRSFVFFQLIHKTENKIIGGCGFHNWLAEHSRAELGYELTDDNFKNQGLMTEAVTTIINFGFSIMKLHRIEAIVGPDNIPSLKIMEHFNFIKEGILKEHYLVNGIYEDSIIFSKLIP